jgi:hypothetical protein
MSETPIKLTIAFNAPDLDAEERDEQAQRLITELKEMDEIETVSRVLDPNPPEGNKALGGFLVGKLATEVKSSHINPLFRLLGERHAHKSVEMEIEVGDRKMKLTAASREELMATLPMVQQFLSQQTGASLSTAHTILIFAANPKSALHNRRMS